MGKLEDFNVFLDCLSQAARQIDPHYFQIEIADLEDSKYRERVYCYELYHQLRCILPIDFEYKLDGEVDKNGHPIIRPRIGPKKPDFIVHIPGNMENNLVIMEVKPITVFKRIHELRQDLQTLIAFLHEADYFRSIMYICGNERNELPSVIIDEIRGCREERILLVWHSRPGESAEIVDYS